MTILKESDKKKDTPNKGNKNNKHATFGIIGIMQAAYGYSPQWNDRGKEYHTKEEGKYALRNAMGVAVTGRGFFRVEVFSQWSEPHATRPR